MNKKKFSLVFITLLMVCTLLSANAASAATKKELLLKNKYLTIYVGDSKALGILKNTTGSKATFTSSKTSVATVSSKGVIKAKKAGKITITVKAGTKIANCVVTVKNKELKLKDSSLTLYTGDSKTLGISVNTTGSKLTFKSSNTSVATVSSKGVIKAKKSGFTVVTVTTGSKSATCKVTVKTKVIHPKELLFIDEGYRCIAQGRTYENAVTIVPSNTTNKDVTYTSSNTSIVTVDKYTGAIKGHQEGIAFITATASNGIKAVCEVEVTAFSFDDGIVSEIPKEKDSTLFLKQGSVNLGETVSELQVTFGTPNRIDDNEYGGQTYVYNSDYSSLLFVYIEDKEVVGYYTNSLSFECAGISSTFTAEEVDNVTGGAAIWTIPGKYTGKVWYDKLGTGRPMAMFLVNDSFDLQYGAEENLQNPSSSLVTAMELETLDLINGFRGREGISSVTLNTNISSVSRAHSKDMLLRGYGNHINPEGLTPSQRLRNAGVSFNSTAEIYSVCFPSGIVYDFTGFMVSTIHRNIILNSSWQYAGPGIEYGEGIYADGFITVNFCN